MKNHQTGGNMKRINANYGVVRSVSGDKTRISISSPRGGVFWCRNEGFEVGQAVCYILDALNREVKKVLPKEVADMQFIMGLNPELQEALQEEPEQETVVIDDDPELMEEIDDYFDGTDEGPSIEEYLDSICEIPGDPIEDWEFGDWPGNQE
jgi:hypothetical protein